MAADLNFAFVLPPIGLNQDIAVIETIRKRDIPDKFATVDFALPTLVVGPTPKKLSDLAKWAKLIPPDVRSAPEFRGDGVAYGSVVDQTVGEIQRKVLAAYQDPDGTQYVMIRLGLQYFGSEGNKSMNNHLLALLSEEITPVKPAAFSFDRQALELAAARDETSLAQMLGDDTSVRTGRAVATRIDTDLSGRKKKFGGLNFAASDFSFWKMPLGSAVICCDINNRLFRIANDRRRTKPRAVDANTPTYRHLFEALQRAEATKRELASRKEVAAAAEQAEA
ncbi:hypothetical protein C4568_00325 [Candidatus Parcubacteria bacterium]|nr:MAG: hypothetical protein C4568_00325 [Candidatus Parcubacteria bacterium]